LLNVALATLDALHQLKSAEQLADMRGKSEIEVSPVWERRGRMNSVRRDKDVDTEGPTEQVNPDDVAVATADASAEDSTEDNE